MKTIGLIGGTSWQSTIDYYRIINEEVESRLKNNHSAKLLLYSIDFAEMEVFIKNNTFHEIPGFLIPIAQTLEKAGADCLLLCANTPHLFAPEVQNSISIPLIHIVDTIIPQIKPYRITKLGLLGTKPTMQMSFYKEKYEVEHMQIIVPDEIDMERIQEIIFKELFKGVINPLSKIYFQDVMEKLILKGAEGIILGCTELPLIIEQEDVSVPIFNTTKIHAVAAVDFALKD